ncbi:MAG TPA: PspC domain-containing protein [Bellilinea sp.]|nr:PspC domain-containing protein [Bellilinea sp.]
METKRLYRSRTETMLGGVCAGLAKYFNLDPTVVRLIFVLLFILAGQGLLIYLILWLVVPLEPAV